MYNHGGVTYELFFKDPVLIPLFTQSLRWVPEVFSRGQRDVSAHTSRPKTAQEKSLAPKVTQGTQSKVKEAFSIET